LVPSQKVRKPSLPGTDPPEAVTVAVKVTDWPGVEGLTELTTVVVVASGELKMVSLGACEVLLE